MAEYTQPMDDETRKYLEEMHPRGHQIIEEWDAQFPPEEQDESDDVPPYEEWTAEDLKAEAKARGLKTSGNKDELAARLYENDRETENQ